MYRLGRFLEAGRPSLGVKFGDTKARVWGSAEAPRLVPFSANDVSASVGKNGGWGEIHVNIEGQRVQFGIIEHTADGPQFMLDKTTTLQSGEVVKLHGRGFTNIAIQKTIAAYKETFGAAPSSLPGSLALENLANFQTEFAAAQGVVRDVAAAGQMAINRTSFGSARVAAGYGNFSIDMANFGDVFIEGKLSQTFHAALLSVHNQID